MTATAPAIGTPVAVPSRAATAGRPEATLIISSGITAVTNYGYTLVVLWLLAPGQYAVFGAVSSLLLLCGTVSSASTPWVLAREVARAPVGSDRRARAVVFGLLSVTVQGVVVGLATAVVASRYSSDITVVVVFGASVGIFVEAAGIGYLQGAERFGLIAGLRVLEVVAKVLAGVGLIALRAGATGAIAGFLVGAALVGIIGIAAMAPDLRWVHGSLRERDLWSSARGLLAVQAGVAVLAGMDVVLASVTLGDHRPLATYQAAQILGRVPVFVGTALSLVLFTRLAKADAGSAEVAKRAASLFVAVCVPVAAVTATLPPAVIAVVFPAGYAGVVHVLPIIAGGGLLMGFVNLLTTVFQALGRFRPAVVVVWAAVALALPAELIGIGRAGIVGLAWAVVGVGAAASLALVVAWRRLHPRAARDLPGRIALLAAACVPLAILHRSTLPWMAYAGLVVGPLVLGALWRLGTEARQDRPDRPRVLHLGFEDPAQPGAGGGSARTHEINRRLAGEMDVTVACASYRGSRQRVVDGVRYVHIGLGGGSNLARMSYFAAIPLVLWRRRQFDLVVEDFGAPLSSVAVPWLTSRPVVGVVQWLFAVEKAKQYHLPFGMIERIGLSSHRTLVTVSEELGREVRRRNPRAAVTVVRNGIGSDAFASGSGERRGLAYLGRLEVAQKGIDLLLDAFSRAAPLISQDLFVAGDGPDRDRVEAMAARLGVGDRVHLVGRVSPADRPEWLAGVELVVMPSRYETFGLVAAEALAAGTPVVAFDIPCLRDLVTPEVGVLVPAFDVAALADAIVALAGDESRRTALGRRGPEQVADLSWDDLAAQQLAVYRMAMNVGARRRDRNTQAKREISDARE